MPIFWHNWICASGSVIAATVVILMLLMLCFYAINEVLGRHTNPYVDLIAFMMLPAFLGVGVVLLLVGNILRRRRQKRGDEGLSAPDLGGQVLVRKAAAVGVAGLLFLVAFGSFSYEAYHFTDSNQFCSKVCHTVMEPEATAYERSPHANVPCVKCHIGPGASWFVRAKLSGLRQVLAVATDSYSRPIPAPVHNLRPARDTCEVCHWPTKFHGSKLMARKHYATDRENTEAMTVNLVYVGGPESGSGRATGIHWHIDPTNEVRYRHIDDARQQIVEIVQKTPGGDVRWLRPGHEPSPETHAADGEPEDGHWRVMDCIDCHNRPTHIYETPVRAIDEAMAAGILDVSVPWLKRAAVAALNDVPPTDDTVAAVAAHLSAWYAAEISSDHPGDAAAIAPVLDESATALAAIIDRNIFPAMNIEWGTYRTNIAHFDIDGEMDESGCFRCHDDEMENEAGDTITQDCDLCHNLLAYEEEGWEGLPGVDPEELFAR